MTGFLADWLLLASWSLQFFVAAFMAAIDFDAAAVADAGCAAGAAVVTLFLTLLLLLVTTAADAANATGCCYCCCCCFLLLFLLLTHWLAIPLDHGAYGEGK